MKQMPLGADTTMIERLVIAHLSTFLFEPTDEVGMQNMSVHLNSAIDDVLAHSFVVSVNEECDKAAEEVAVEFIAGGEKYLIYVSRESVRSAQITAEENFGLMIDYFAKHLPLLTEAGRNSKADPRLVNLGHTKLQEAFMCFRRSIDPVVKPDAY